ncbi:uncharacterized protein B0I36DRAFT_428843 [Microdochium trichocladiopsis]|uniref:Uncharacterized protein n=1 Tax=Microdochium trichocladiopsis TaxID=1682393 RepID=A0A9P8YGC6_9PEZI|nr:uncharacterized protein B0I36DRAFT_428843 [Microdochium trichocladiopsis]KAH7038451.1 hypothetical protein B0I36DRAFT_428843 [Microdochium trichocladiopsis]
MISSFYSRSYSPRRYARVAQGCRPVPRGSGKEVPLFNITSGNRRHAWSREKRGTLVGAVEGVHSIHGWFHCSLRSSDHPTLPYILCRFTTHVCPLDFNVCGWFPRSLHPRTWTPEIPEKGLCPGCDCGGVKHTRYDPDSEKDTGHAGQVPLPLRAVCIDQMVQVHQPARNILRRVSPAHGTQDKLAQQAGHLLPHRFRRYHNATLRQLQAWHDLCHRAHKEVPQDSSPILPDRGQRPTSHRQPMSSRPLKKRHRQPPLRTRRRKRTLRHTHRSHVIQHVLQTLDHRQANIGVPPPNLFQPLLRGWS